MRTLWKNQFLFWNIVALILIKAAFTYPGQQLASLVGNFTPFTKEEVISQTNALRLEGGLGGLKENQTLDAAASEKLQDMIDSQYFAHTSPLGVSPWHWIEINKYNFSYAGENLAIGFWNARDTVNAWANSPTHRENLLNSNFKEIGVAVATAKIRDTRGFLVVQLFGTQKTKKVQIPIRISSKQNVKTAFQNLQPTIINAAVPSGRFNKTAEMLNGAFALYALAIFLVALLFLVFAGTSRALFVKMAIGFALVLLTLTIPVLHAVYPALIL